MATVFREQLSGETLDEFAQRKVSMTETENRRYSEQVARFVHFLHDQPFGSGYSVKEVFKSGSLGKGTAVRGLADIDLVVFVNGLGDIDALAKARKKLFRDLVKKLKTSLGIAPKGRSKYSLTYEWNGIEVDILPAVDILSEEEEEEDYDDEEEEDYDDDEEEDYDDDEEDDEEDEEEDYDDDEEEDYDDDEEDEDEEEDYDDDDDDDEEEEDDDEEEVDESALRVYDVMAQYQSAAYAAQQFSASLAPLQRDFVKEVPEHVKRVIRLVKLWKKENHLDIRSYSLELLTISVWRSLGKGNPGTAFLFRKFMGQLGTCGTLRVAFNDNYNSGTYTRNMKAPYILDPANPYMNTLHGVSIGEVSECAKRALKKI